MLGLMATSAQAVVSVNTTTAASFSVSNTDLLQTSVSSVISDGFDFRQSGGQTTFLNALETEGITVGTASLTDGVWYNHDPSVYAAGGGNFNDVLDNANTESRGSAVNSENTSGTWNLDVGASPDGYNITQIDLYSNWGNGDGRNAIRTTISVSLVGDAGFVALDNPGGGTLFTYNPVSTGDVNGTQGLLSITGLELTNVDAIRFAFDNLQENNGVGYSEFDVFGSAVPEPTTALLGGLGGLLLLRRRRA